MTSSVRANLAICFSSDRRACPQRSRQRPLVEIVEFASDRHAMRQPGDLHLKPGYLVGYIVRCGLPFDRCVDGDDDLTDAALVYPVDQGADVEIVGADAVERGKRSAEHVIGGDRKSTRLNSSH